MFVRPSVIEKCGSTNSGDRSKSIPSCQGGPAPYGERQQSGRTTRSQPVLHERSENFSITPYFQKLYNHLLFHLHTMSLKIPESMDECMYFTNRGEILAWVYRTLCPKC